MFSSSSSPSLSWVVPSPSQSLLKSPICPLLHIPNQIKIVKTSISRSSIIRFSNGKTRATLDDTQSQNATTTSVLVQDEKEEEQLSQEVVESVKVLKYAAKTRKVPAKEILAAFSVLEKAKIDPSGFLETLGGTKSPGRTWMLVFTAEKKLESGKYFPITAVQRFDAAGKRIENGVYFGRLGSLTFEGRLSWKNRILAFIFERIRIKIGLINPLEFNFKGKDEREPSKQDPFFIWFYIDEEIAVARGKSGGTAFWVRCKRVNYS